MSSRPYASPFQDYTGAFLEGETAIRNLTQDYCMAFNTGNYDQAAAMYAQEGLFMPSNQEAVQGPRAIERTIQSYADAGYQDLRMEMTRFQYTGDLAVEVGRYRLSIRRADNTLVIDQGKYMRAWRRLGAWRLIADCWNSNLPTGGN